MRREENGDALGCLRNKHLQEMFDSHRIKPFAWLIQNQQLRTAGECQEQSELCPHSFGQRFDFPLARQFVFVEEFACDIRAPVSVERTPKAYLLFNSHVPL